MFKRAKIAWLVRDESKFVTYALRERYVWRGRTHDNWWEAAYRDSDRALVLHRRIVAEDEDARLKGFPIKLNVHWHHGTTLADALDTNPDSDAFPILDPLIDPNASFGMLARDSTAVLSMDHATAVPGASPSPTPQPAPSPSAAPGEKPLRELARIEVVARDYEIAFAGTERVGDADALHLTLRPLRDPGTYRLRDLWLDPQTYETLRLAMDGLFNGKPYAGARWVVTYVRMDGRYYVSQIRTDDDLRFGLDRVVSNLEYDFVGYDFPASLPASTFIRLL